MLEKSKLNRNGGQIETYLGVNLFIEEIKTLDKLENEIGDVLILSIDIGEKLEIDEPFIRLMTFKAENGHVISLYLENLYLTSLPDCINKFTHLRELNISDNTEFESFPEVICKLSNLQKLRLNNCNITYIPESIGNLTKLKELDLNSNYRLTSFPESFGNLTNLQKLVLSTNNIYPPEIDKLSNLKNLISLDIASNNLGSIPKGIFQITSLKQLNLIDNRITKLPKSVGKLINLEEILLGHNNIKEIPVEISKLVNLKVLDLQYNKISIIPGSFLNLVNIKSHYLYKRLLSQKSTKEVDISNEKKTELVKTTPINVAIKDYNGKSFIAAEVEILKNLEEIVGTTIDRFDVENHHITNLNLNSKPLKSFPSILCNLTYLKVLSLRGTELESLPECIRNLINLETFEAYKSKLKFLPASIGLLSNLKSLDLGATSITALPESIGKLKQLEFLSFSCAKLTSLPVSIGDLVNLKQLILQENQLILIPESIGNLRKLTILRLDNNELTLLPKSIGNLVNLENFDISFNQLNSIPQSIMNCSNLRTLKIDYTQLLKIARRLKTKTIVKPGYKNIDEVSIIYKNNLFIHHKKKSESSISDDVEISKILISLKEIIKLSEGIKDDRKIKLTSIKDEHRFNISRISLCLLNEKFKELNKEDSSYWFHLARLAWKLKLFKESEILSRFIINIDPKNVEGWGMIGNLLINAGRNNDAKKAYFTALSYQPEEYEILTLLGNLLFRENRIIEAENMYRKAIEINPDYNRAWSNLGSTLSSNRQFEEAEEAYYKAIELENNDSFSWYGIGNIYYNYFFKVANIVYCGKDQKEKEIRDQKIRSYKETTINALKTALKYKPDYVKAWFKLASFYGARNYRDEAIEAYQELLKYQPKNYAAWHNLGLYLVQEDRVDEAIEACQQTLKYQPKDCLEKNWLKEKLQEKNIVVDSDLESLLAEYHGIKIYKEEIPFLVELETNLGNPLVRKDNLFFEFTRREGHFMERFTGTPQKVKKGRFFEYPNFKLEDYHIVLLDLGHTELSSLPASIENLTYLRELNLENNQLKTLPESINTLINLERLHLNRNKLTKLPQNLENLTRLLVLRLENNPSLHFPESLEILRKNGCMIRKD